MKIQFCLFLGLIGISAMAQTIVIRQPGLLEAVGSATVGTVRCVGEFATGIVAGNTTVIQAAPAYAVPAAVPAVVPAAYASGYAVPAVVQPIPVAPVPVVIAPSPVTCAPVVYPCRPCYGPRYIPRRRCCSPYLGCGRYGGLLPGPGPVYGPCY